MTESLDDAKFKQFLKNADEIESIEHFTYWKDEFLETFRQYLNPAGTRFARESDEELYDELDILAQNCVKVKKMVSEGKITPEKRSVKGQNSINELVSNMAKCESHINKYMPKTQAEEKSAGYGKFELAAVLVRDGFRVYGLMVSTRDYILRLESGVLSEVLKPNQKSIISYYVKCLESFTQTMADLGLFKLMTKCVEIYKVRPRKKKKKKRYSAANSTKDALSDTSGSGSENVINGGRMFRRAKSKSKAIMDNGWASGLDGKEVKPKKSIRKSKSKSIADATSSSDKKKRKSIKDKKKTKKDDISSSSTGITTSSDDIATNTVGDGNEDLHTGLKTIAELENQLSSDEGLSKDVVVDDDDDDDDNDTLTMSSQYEESDEEEDSEDDKEFIYYFDPVNRIVGKVSRKKCLEESIILSVDKDKDTEKAEGSIEEWESKDGKQGKTEIISILKDILRGKAVDKVNNE